MPHLILEYSDNVLEKKTFPALFSACHQLLVKQLPTNLVDCKSRAVLRQQYCVGEGASENAFVHVTLKLLSGRSLQVLEGTGQALMTLLNQHFSASIQQLKLQVSLEIEPLSLFYFK